MSKSWQRIRVFGGALLACWTLACQAAGGAATESAAADPAPVLMLDPGTHTAPIRRIALDAGQTMLATVSDDKTARIWRVADGTLLATLRPPAGKEQVGRLYGVSISPQGRIAVAGTTAVAGGKHRIYLFDLASYAFLQAFDARGGDIKRLEWSPDGKLLAAAYAGDPALRVFDARGALIYEERFSGDAYYAAFSSNGRMAVSATDGQIHLYAVAGGKVTQDGVIKASLKDPRAVHFSPDGGLLAVGYLSRQSNSTVRVDVLDVAARSMARSFVFSDVSQGNLMNVAWQSDGRALYTGGTGYQGKNSFLVKRISWPEGKVGNVVAATNSILDFAALRDGRMVYSTVEPSWAIVDGERIVNTVSAPTAQFYEAAALRLNRDASELSWNPRVGDSPVSFNLATRQLKAGTGDATRKAETSSSQVPVVDWENNFFPKVGNNPIQLEPTEVARASAVLPDKSGAILGSSRSLRRFDQRGKTLWLISLATEVRAVNLSEDGKLMVCAMLDGSLRWRRVDDGSLLLSLFATRDGKWVLWTEQGYFDASAGAENLIGWLVNRSNGDAADYYAISRFRERYYRPDVIDRVLLALDAAKAVADANNERKALAARAEEPVRQRIEALVKPQPVLASLPPSITLVSPSTVQATEATLSIDYKLFSPDGSPVTAFDLRLDGRPYDQFENRKPASVNGDSIGKLTVTMPRNGGTLQVFAANSHGISAPAAVSIQRLAPAAEKPVAEKPVAEKPAAEKPTAEKLAPVKPAVTKLAEEKPADLRPRLFMLAVGVSKYANPKYNLNLADKDAGDFSEAFLKQNGRFYRQVDARLLTNQRATSTAVKEGLQWLKQVTGGQDVGILYVAGHGINDIDDTYYFIPHDADVARLRQTGVSEESFRDALTNMKGKSLFFVDTCYSGKSVGIFSNQDLTRIANKFSSPEFGVIVFSASHGRQLSMESDEWGNGVFTKAILDGLAGQADFRKEGTVTHRGLDYYIGGAVTKLTKGMQTPVTTVPTGLPDFAISQVLPKPR